MNSSPRVASSDLMSRIRSVTCTTALAIFAIAVASCGAASHATDAARHSGAHRASAAACPNPEGGACLGRLGAGTYRTSVFRPSITYRVPSGWANFEDLPGNFLLVPPGNTLPGVNAGTSDFIGIYSGLAAVTARCGERPDQDVATTPAAIARAWRQKNYLGATPPRRVTVGGLKGLVIDLRLPKGFKKSCPFPDFTDPLAVVATGVPPSSLLHGVIPGLVLRFYLLKNRNRTLAIEVDALKDGKNLARYARLVRRVKFDA
jgi:hypothetical protein